MKSYQHPSCKQRQLTNVLNTEIKAKLRYRPGVGDVQTVPCRQVHLVEFYFRHPREQGKVYSVTKSDKKRV